MNCSCGHDGHSHGRLVSKTGSENYCIGSATCLCRLFEPASHTAECECLLPDDHARGFEPEFRAPNVEESRG